MFPSFHSHEPCDWDCHWWAIHDMAAVQEQVPPRLPAWNGSACTLKIAWGGISCEGGRVVGVNLQELNLTGEEALLSK